MPASCGSWHALRSPSDGWRARRCSAASSSRTWGTCPARRSRRRTSWRRLRLRCALRKRGLNGRLVVRRAVGASRRARSELDDGRRARRFAAFACRCSRRRTAAALSSHVIELAHRPSVRCSRGGEGRQDRQCDGNAKRRAHLPGFERVCSRARGAPLRRRGTSGITRARLVLSHAAMKSAPSLVSGDGSTPCYALRDLLSAPRRGLPSARDATKNDRRPSPGKPVPLGCVRSVRQALLRTRRAPLSTAIREAPSRDQVVPTGLFQARRILVEPRGGGTYYYEIVSDSRDAMSAAGQGGLCRLELRAETVAGSFSGDPEGTGGARRDGRKGTMVGLRRSAVSALAPRARRRA